MCGIGSIGVVLLKDENEILYIYYGSVGYIVLFKYVFMEKISFGFVVVVFKWIKFFNNNLIY